MKGCNLLQVWMQALRHRTGQRRPFQNLAVRLRYVLVDVEANVDFRNPTRAFRGHHLGDFQRRVSNVDAPRLGRLGKNGEHAGAQGSGQQVRGRKGLAQSLVVQGRIRFDGFPGTNVHAFGSVGPGVLDDGG